MTRSAAFVPRVKCSILWLLLLLLYYGRMLASVRGLQLPVSSSNTKAPSRGLTMIGWIQRTPLGRHHYSSSPLVTHVEGEPSNLDKISLASQEQQQLLTQKAAPIAPVSPFARPPVQDDDDDDDDNWQCFFHSSLSTRATFVRSLTLSTWLVAGATTTGPGTARALVPAVSNNVATSNSPAPPTTTTTTTTTSAQESLSGFVAGAALTATKTLVKYPLDTATVRLQMPSSTYSIYSPVALLRGSYRGVIAPLLSNIPAGAVFFAVKDATKVALKQQAELWSQSWLLPGWVRTCLAVGIAQFPYWLVRNPSEVVKTRQQTNLPGYVGPNVTVWTAWQQVRIDHNEAQQRQASSVHVTHVNQSWWTGWWTAYYVGYFENIWYAYPADVLKFLLYDQMAGLLLLSMGDGGTGALSPAQGALAGAIATAAAQLLTTPLDVVRNRIMAQQQQQQQEQQPSSRNSAREDRWSSTSYLGLLIRLAQEEGYRGLLAGATPRVGKALISGAIQFATYEETKQAMAQFFFSRG